MQEKAISQGQRSLQIWQTKQRELLQICRNLEEVLVQIEANDSCHTLDMVNYRLQSDTFKVLIIGEFKRGKSTLVNALLGEKILPAYATPCTATITEIKWGELPKAILHYKTPADTPPQTKTVPVEALEKHITINEDLQSKPIVRDNPYSKVEIHYPLSLCSHGVELIDSPGLNESSVREQVTLNYLPLIDATLFVLSSDCLASQTELRVIDSLREAGYEDIFFICNRFDQIDEEDRPRIVQRAKTQLLHRTRRGDQGLFFVSARDGLRGKLKADQELLDESGILMVEQTLETFLAHERGDVRLRLAGRELRRAIREGRRTIPEMMAMLQVDFKVFEQRVEEARLPLRSLEAKHQNIIDRIRVFREEIKQLVFEKAKCFFRKSATEVDDWIQTCQPQRALSVLSGQGMKAQADELADEIVEHLATQLQESFTQWQKTELRFSMENMLNHLRSDLDERIREFLVQAEQIRIDLAKAKLNDDYKPFKEASPLDRIISTVAGLYLISPGAAVTGAMFGWRELVKGILPQVTVALAAVILLANPIGVAVAISAAELIRLSQMGKQVAKKIKEHVSKQYSSMLLESSYERAYQVAGSIDSKLGQLQEAVDEGLRKEIQGILDRVSAVKEEKQKGEAYIDARLQQLQVCSAGLDEIETQLEALLPESP